MRIRESSGGIMRECEVLSVYCVCVNECIQISIYVYLRLCMHVGDCDRKLVSARRVKWFGCFGKGSAGARGGARLGHPRIGAPEVSPHLRDLISGAGLAREARLSGPSRKSPCSGRDAVTKEIHKSSYIISIFFFTSHFFVPFNGVYNI